MGRPVFCCLKCGNIRGKYASSDDVCVWCGTLMSTIEIDTDYVDAAAIFEKYVKGNSDFSEMAHNKRLQKIEVISQKNIAESARSTIASQPVSCPKCGSTQIQMVQRKWSPLTGFFTNKVDRVCVSCKNKF